MLDAEPATSGAPTAGRERVLMTYYGDGNGAVTDLEQNRLDVMPSDTLDPAGRAAAASARAACASIHSPAIGLEYWVFNLARNVTSRVHEEVVRSRAIRTALAWAIDRPKLVQAAVLGYGAPGNTQLPRSYGGFTLDLSDDPTLGYHYDPARARRILDQPAGGSAPDGVRRKDGVRAEFELAYAGEASEKRAVTLIRSWARDVGIEIDVRIYDTDKLIDLEINTRTATASCSPTSTPSCGRSAATRRRSSCSRCSRRPRSASGTTRASSTRRYEQLYKQEIAGDRRRRARRATSTSSSASRRCNLPYIELYEADDISAVNTRTWQNWTTQPSPDGQPITSYGYDTIIALRPGDARERRAIRACPGRSRRWPRWRRSASARRTWRTGASSASRSRSRTPRHEAARSPRSSRWR